MFDFQKSYLIVIFLIFSSPNFQPRCPPLVGKCLGKMRLAAKLTGTWPDADMIHHIIWLGMFMVMMLMVMVMIMMIMLVNMLMIIMNSSLQLFAFQELYTFHNWSRSCLSSPTAYGWIFQIGTFLRIETLSLVFLHLLSSGLLVFIEYTITLK